MTSNPLPPLPATSLTLLTGSVCPLGPVSTQSAVVKVEKFMARSNVTRTLETVTAVGPIGTLLTMTGAGGGAPTAAAALTMPPVTTLPVRAVDFSAVARIWSMTWPYFQVGWAAHTSAAVPATNGVAI